MVYCLLTTAGSDISELAFAILNTVYSSSASGISHSSSIQYSRLEIIVWSSSFNILCIASIISFNKFRYIDFSADFKIKI